MSFKFNTLFAKLAGVKCAMVDLETFCVKPTAAFYAIGARIFEPGLDIGPSAIDPDVPVFELTNSEYLQYIEPVSMLHDPRFSVRPDTLDWTVKHNKVELDRAYAHGLDLYVVLTSFMEWLKFHDVKFVFSNSPRFDASILEHAYDVCDLRNPYLHFRNDMDVRTIRTLLDWMGHPKHTEVEGIRLHSPLDDCRQQILDVNRFLHLLASVSGSVEAQLLAQAIEEQPKVD